MPPSTHVAVLTCMDARLHPERFLGLQIGDAHVIRNAGGRASDDAIRSLIISSRLLGTREFLVIHHTDCGMLTFSNDDLRQKLAEEAGADASEIDFLPFADLEESVREDVRRILEPRSSRRTSPCPVPLRRPGRTAGGGRWGAARPRRLKEVAVSPIGIPWEHPQWFRPLFFELDRRGIPNEPIHAGTL